MYDRRTLALAAALLGVALCPALPASAAPPTSVFLHTATTANSTLQVTYLDNSVTNGNPNAIVMVTPNWNPPGSSGVYAPNPIGVWYNPSNQRWSIFDERHVNIDIGAAYNVRATAYAGTASEGRRHVATSANTAWNFTDIDDPATNNNPNAVVLVTHNWGAPGGSAAIYDTSAVGVWYNASSGKWSIFNEDGATMPVGIAFNYAVGGGAFVHRSTTANTQNISTFINNSRTNGRPGALILTTHNWNPGNSGGQYNDSALGVWYSAPMQRWAIFNERDKAFPTPFNIVVGTAFNVRILN